MKIRKLEYNDFSVASELLWKSYHDAEKNNTSMHGMETFRDLVSPVVLQMAVFNEEIELFGAFDEDELVGVSGIKNKSHLLLLFVKTNRQRQGIGQKLFDFSLKIMDADIITLKASDMGLPFYLKNGFEVSGERTEEDGIIFTPMIKKR